MPKHRWGRKVGTSGVSAALCGMLLVTMSSLLSDRAAMAGFIGIGALVRSHNSFTDSEPESTQTRDEPDIFM